METFEPDYYTILNIKRGADPEQIRAAFRELAKQYHPDKGVEDQEEFIKIRHAYEVLNDARRRKDYDRYLDLLIGEESLIELKPTLRDLFDDMLGYLKSLSGFGNDSEYDLILKQEFEFKDKIVKLQIPLQDVCRRCLGTGGTMFKQCSYCGGSGKYVYEHSFDVFIPSGSTDGEVMLLKFPGQRVKLRLRFK